jgi:hypothetical protein
VSSRLGATSDFDLVAAVDLVSRPKTLWRGTGPSQQKLGLLVRIGVAVEPDSCHAAVLLGLAIAKVRRHESVEDHGPTHRQR